MGQLTRAQIVAQGAALAAYPVASLGTVVNVQLNAELRKAYASWPWPFLQRRIETFPLAAGARLVSFGAGAAGGPALEVKRIHDPIFLYDASYTSMSRVRVRDLTGGAISDDETVQNPATNLGTPIECKVRQDPTTPTWGQWQLAFNPVPDRAYVLAVDYIIQPADLDTSSAGDSLRPLYPGDESLIQMAVTCVLRFANRNKEYAVAMELLGSMLVNDRLRYGDVAGTNDNIGLNPGVFRGSAYSGAR